MIKEAIKHQVYDYNIFQMSSEDDVELFEEVLQYNGDFLKTNLIQ